MESLPRKFLLVDAGNSRTKVWQLEELNLVSQIVFDNNDQETIQTFFSSGVWHRILISNTGFEATDLRAMFPKSNPVFLDHTHNMGINWSYEKPGQMGKDRMAALIGASKLYHRKNICVVDAGTCLTIDGLDSNRNHLGGVIAPGLKMRWKSMHEMTSKLPLSSENELIGHFGNSTKSCLASGSIWGTIAEIEFHFQRMIDEGFTNPILLITGGDADFLATKIKVPNFVDSDLVFKGMIAVLASLV